jgi:hypothetical protein
VGNRSNQCQLAQKIKAMADHCTVKQYILFPINS